MYATFIIVNYLISASIPPPQASILFLIPIRTLTALKRCTFISRNDVTTTIETNNITMKRPVQAILRIDWMVSTQVKADWDSAEAADYRLHYRPRPRLLHC